jgi:hypothetical protein
MTNQHPITPPPELVEQWRQEHTTTYNLARQAAGWGADQELEACCKWTAIVGGADALRTARRPKPPSLKEQALEWLIAAEELHKVSGIDPEGTIRRALEALDA